MSLDAMGERSHPRGGLTTPSGLDAVAIHRQVDTNPKGILVAAVELPSGYSDCYKL